jgi:NADPH2:quinone reductase
MKSLLCTAFGPLETLQVQDVAVPAPGPRQVRIDVKAASLNFPDALIVQGRYQVRPPLPFAPGFEFAGTVSAVGTDVGHLQLGDRVVATGLVGGFAEEALAEASSTVPLPAGMDYAQAAAFFLTYCTSLRGLKDCGRLAPGETLLVLGAAGGVGTAAVEIGRALGATVIAAASSAAKLALCRRLGAEHLIDYEREPLRERCDAITGGKGVDVVYDPVGGAYTEEALRALGWRGRLVVVGFAAGSIPKIPTNLALLKERTIVGVYFGDSVQREPRAHAANVALLLEWYASGKVRPVISERVPLAGAVDAMQRMLRREVTGKVVVLPEA